MSTQTAVFSKRKADPNSDSTVPPELLDVQAVAALLGGCSTRHVYRLADSGHMPRPIKLGALVRWRRAELMSWLEGGCQPFRPTKATPR